MITTPKATLQAPTRREWLAAFAAWFHGGALLMERGRDVRDFFTEEEQEMSDCSLDTASYLVVYKVAAAWNSATTASRSRSAADPRSPPAALAARSVSARAGRGPHGPQHVLRAAALGGLARDGEQPGHPLRAAC